MNATPTPANVPHAHTAKRASSLLQRAAWQRAAWAVAMLGLLWLALLASMSTVD